MKPTRRDYERKRREVLDLLYTMIDELEHNPSLRRRKGFPFDILESSANKLVDMLDAAIKRIAMPGIERWLEKLRKRWEKNMCWKTRPCSMNSSDR